MRTKKIYSSVLLLLFANAPYLSAQSQANTNNSITAVPQVISNNNSAELQFARNNPFHGRVFQGKQFIDENYQFVIADNAFEKGPFLLETNNNISQEINYYINLLNGDHCFFKSSYDKKAAEMIFKSMTQMESIYSHGELTKFANMYINLNSFQKNADMPIKMIIGAYKDSVNVRVKKIQTYGEFKDDSQYYTDALSIEKMVGIYNRFETLDEDLQKTSYTKLVLSSLNDKMISEILNFKIINLDFKLPVPVKANGLMLDSLRAEQAQLSKAKEKLQQLPISKFLPMFKLAKTDNFATSLSSDQQFTKKLNELTVNFRSWDEDLNSVDARLNIVNNSIAEIANKRQQDLAAYNKAVTNCAGGIMQISQNLIAGIKTSIPIYAIHAHESESNMVRNLKDSPQVHTEKFWADVKLNLQNYTNVIPAKDGRIYFDEFSRIKGLLK